MGLSPPSPSRAPMVSSHPPSGSPSRTPAATTFANDRVLALLLSAVAGYVDTAGFLALFGLFPAHLTGDLVTAGAAMAARVQLGVVARLAMIPLFMFSVAAAAMVTRSVRSRGTAPLTPLLALMTIALAIFCVTGVALGPLANGPDARAVILIGGTGVVAMGIQNALMREALEGMTPTTIMTGNLTQFTIDLVELALPSADAGREERAEARARIRGRLIKFGTPLFGFVSGAALGAWLTGRFALWSIGLPTLVVAAVTIVAGRTTRRDLGLAAPTGVVAPPSIDAPSGIVRGNLEEPRGSGVFPRERRFTALKPGPRQRRFPYRSEK